MKMGSSGLASGLGVSPHFTEHLGGFWYRANSQSCVGLVIFLTCLSSQSLGAFQGQEMTEMKAGLSSREDI